MATSGSIDFNQTRNEIIQDAYQLIGVYGIGRTISDEDQAFAERSLNRMVKHWQAKGLHLWAQEEAVLFLEDNTGQYDLSSDASSARATTYDDAVVTELNGAVAASATSLTVDTTTGMAASDAIGIVLDDDTVHWTTIVSVDSSTALTITSGVASAAADNNNVYTYTTRLNRPLRIHSVRRVDGVGTTETSIPLLELSRQDFFDLPQKNTNGLPTHYYYDPQLSAGRLYIWPRPNDPELYMRFSFERSLEDFDAAGNNPDFPQEWLDTLVHQLAVRLAEAFGKDQKLMTLVPKAQALLEDIMNWDCEVQSMFIEPDHRR